MSGKLFDGEAAGKGDGTRTGLLPPLPENSRSADVSVTDCGLVDIVLHSDVIYRAPSTQEADAPKELPQCADFIF